MLAAASPGPESLEGTHMTTGRPCPQRPTGVGRAPAVRETDARPVRGSERQSVNALSGGRSAPTDGGHERLPADGQMTARWRT